MKIKDHIPNLLTLGNLVCGVVAIVVLFETKDPKKAAWTIAALMSTAMVLDFFDGFVARALKVSSPLGKELDSLADCVTFGVLPGLLAYHMIRYDAMATFPIGLTGREETGLLLPLLALLIPVFSAYRLAKFNIDTRQSYGFIGLPTPANALFFLSLFMIHNLDVGFADSGFNPFGNETIAVPSDPGILYWLVHEKTVAILSVVFSFLLVAEIPLMAMKFKGFGWKENWPKFVFMGLSLIMGIVLFYKAVPIIIVLYFVISQIEIRTHKK